MGFNDVNVVLRGASITPFTKVYLRFGPKIHRRFKVALPQGVIVCGALTWVLRVYSSVAEAAITVLFQLQLLNWHG